jgi:hypothetical protein
MDNKDEEMRKRKLQSRQTLKWLLQEDNQGRLFDGSKWVGNEQEP